MMVLHINIPVILMTEKNTVININTNTASNYKFYRVS